MNRIFRLVIFPIIGTILATIIAIVAIIKQQLLVQESVFTVWTTPVIICLFIALVISIFQAITTFRNEYDKEHRVIFHLFLREIREQPDTLNVWLKDPRQVTGTLSVIVTKGSNKKILLRRSIRYGELTDPSSPSDHEYLEDVANSSFISANSLKGWDFTLLFEPNINDIRISSIYDRDDMQDYVLDATVANNGTQRVLIATYEYQEEKSKLRSLFDEPDKILVVSTNARPIENEVASFFNVIQRVRFDINGETVLESPINEKGLTYEFLIGGEMKNGIYSKTCYYFGIAARFSLPCLNPEKKDNWRAANILVNSSNNQTKKLKK